MKLKKHNMIPFIKMHGLGNDFIFIDKANLPAAFNAEFIQKIAHRKTGIGCDQLIVYSYLSPKRYLMEIYNSDGSSAKMCGNATRCLALYIFQQHQEKDVEIIVGDKVLKVKILDNGLVQANMGPAQFEADWMPKAGALMDIAYNYGLNPKEIVCVDVGNPHIVIFYNDLTRQDQYALGERIQKMFDEIGGINVNFAKFVDDKIDLKVWERGVGFTMACGSGACATFAAGRKLKFIDQDVIISFHVGNLFMSSLNQDIIMSGSAHKIAIGSYYG